MERIIDLNGRENCVTAVIKVSDMSFRISRVVTGVRVIYANYLREMGALMSEVGRLDASTAPAEQIQALTEKANAFSSKAEEVLSQCISLILTRNGYEYDSAWWEMNTDQSDARAFIDACLGKDASVKKK